MTRRFQSILWVVVWMLVLASCSSTKSLKSSRFIEGMTEADYLETVMSNTGGWDALTAKMTLVIDGGSKDATKVNGMLRIKKGEVIQISIVPLLGIEVGRAEISPEGVLVIDRINKRYVEVSFAELKAIANADLNFHVLQSLFLNELFLPGKSDLTSRDVSAFKVAANVDGVTLDVKKSGRFSYRFSTQAPEALLTESCIGLRGTPYQMKWQYDDFRPLEQKQFPADMEVSFEGGKKTVKTSFALSRLSTNANWETHTEVSRKYQKVELDDILKQLLKK